MNRQIDRQIERMNIQIDRQIERMNRQIDRKIERMNRQIDRIKDFDATDILFTILHFIVWWKL